MDFGEVFIDNHPGTTTKPVLETIMKTLIKYYLGDTRGATMIEYGLIAALVAVVLIGTLTTLGGSLDTMFYDISSAL
jgi:pilus assembly protein Flp/PilA